MGANFGVQFPHNRFIVVIHKDMWHLLYQMNASHHMFQCSQWLHQFWWKGSFHQIRGRYKMPANLWSPDLWLKYCERELRLRWLAPSGGEMAVRGRNANKFSDTAFLIISSLLFVIWPNLIYCIPIVSWYHNWLEYSQIKYGSTIPRWIQHHHHLTVRYATTPLIFRPLKKPSTLKHRWPE